MEQLFTIISIFIVLVLSILLYKTLKEGKRLEAEVLELKSKNIEFEKNLVESRKESHQWMKKYSEMFNAKLELEHVLLNLNVDIPEQIQVLRSKEAKRREVMTVKMSMGNRKYSSHESAYSDYRNHGGTDDFDTFLTLGIMYLISEHNSGSSSTSYD